MISGAYNFAQASEAFADLPKALDAAAARSESRRSSKRKTVSDVLFKCNVSDRGKSERSTSAESGALDALKARLPSDTDVTTVGKTIHDRCVLLSFANPCA